MTNTPTLDRNSPKEEDKQQVLKPGNQYIFTYPGRGAPQFSVTPNEDSIMFNYTDGKGKSRGGFHNLRIGGLAIGKKPVPQAGDSTFPLSDSDVNVSDQQARIAFRSGEIVYEHQGRNAIDRPRVVRVQPPELDTAKANDPYCTLPLPTDGALERNTAHNIAYLHSGATHHFDFIAHEKEPEGSPKRMSRLDVTVNDYDVTLSYTYDGETKEQSFNLKQGPISIGRSAENAFVIPGGSISREQGAIFIDDGIVKYMHLGQVKVPKYPTSTPLNNETIVQAEFIRSESELGAQHLPGKAPADVRLGTEPKSATEIK